MFDTIATAARIPTRPTANRSGLGLMDLIGLRRQRQHLKGLTPEQLADIGVTASEAEAEAERPIWDVPSYWRA